MAVRKMISRIKDHSSCPIRSSFQSSFNRNMDNNIENYLVSEIQKIRQGKSFVWMDKNVNGKFASIINFELILENSLLTYEVNPPFKNIKPAYWFPDFR